MMRTARRATPGNMRVLQAKRSVATINTCCYFSSRAGILAAALFTPSSMTAIKLGQNKDFRAFCRGEQPFVCISNAFDHDDNDSTSSSTNCLMRNLKMDATCLQRNGFGATAGIASDKGKGDNTSDPTTIRRNVHQIWLSNPGDTTSNPLQNVFCGHPEARQYLIKLVQQ